MKQNDPAIKAETPEPSATSLLDSRLHAAAARLTMGLSPIAMGLAMTDWSLHLAAAPGRQIELANLALKSGMEVTQHWGASWLASGQSESGNSGNAGKPDNQWQASMEKVHDWWRQATHVRGVTPHHQQVNEFMINQIFAMAEPANWPLTHPEAIKAAILSGGQSLLKGGENLIADLQKKIGLGAPEEVSQYRVGENIAATPGHVVYRNHLVELIQYTPQTKTVHPEPILIVPSWIMKYYILDLSPHNSMVNYLVRQGHTVYILSWHNPDKSDRMLGMNDYLQQGIFDVLTELTKYTKQVPVHTVGYCLGGTLLAIAVAALSRPEKVPGFEGMATIKSMTLLAAQTDFSEPGEMGVLIDDSQVHMIEDLMVDKGYMSGAQMAGSFQFLNSRDLVWNKRLREYLLGVRDSGSDMMAWNEDVTRLPARMHGEYLHQFFLENALAEGQYQVEGKPVSLLDIRVPVFAVGTVRDTVSPWKSVYKIMRLTRTDITFLLASGGHNVGIVSEPGNPKASYQVQAQGGDDLVMSPAQWEENAKKQAGSWWPCWENWLAGLSGPHRAPPRVSKNSEAAPGTYVFKRHH